MENFLPKEKIGSLHFLMMPSHIPKRGIVHSMK
ncbi:hypothetical protein BLA15816_01975 [Burkholderia lata]|nr:hypothetical protein BLA15816_01975 [Burkholderia lata]